MRPQPEVADIEADTNTPHLASALLRAFSGGSALVGIYDDCDYLRFANAPFREAFGIAIGQTVTFSDIILGAARGENALRIDSGDPLAFISDAQTGDGAKSKKQDNGLFRSTSSTTAGFGALRHCLQTVG